jgi:hypothetical protein
VIGGQIVTGKLIVIDEDIVPDENIVIVERE